VNPVQGICPACQSSLSNPAAHVFHAAIAQERDSTAHIVALIGWKKAVYRRKKIQPTDVRIGFVLSDNVAISKVNALPALCFSGRLQSASGKELSVLMPWVLVRAFKEEL
jgi:hypothetical protein